MSDGFAYIDILFFAMVAAFIALRLRSVLGRRTGHERRRTGNFPDPSRANGAGDGANDNVVALPDRTAGQEEVDPAIAGMGDGEVKTGLTQIRLADPTFDLNQFLGGARGAFEMIVDAYASGDKDSLRPLLADDVFAGFSGAIEQRVADGHTLDSQLVGIQEAEVVDAGMHDDMARVSVRFTSEQVNVVRDAEGRAIEGDPNSAEEVVDIWTFERDTRSSDPNWALVETRTPS
ncbi:MAG: Tim44/TimA family putative adaptor protein [Pseudomonadota bacterium]